MTLTLDPTQLDIFQQLKETVDITRLDLDVDPLGGTEEDVVNSVETLILPATTQGDQITGTGQVYLEGFYDAVMASPNDSIQTGDIFNRGAGVTPNKMYVVSAPIIANVQSVRLSTTKRSSEQ